MTYACDVPLVATAAYPQGSHCGLPAGHAGPHDSRSWGLVPAPPASRERTDTVLAPRPHQCDPTTGRPLPGDQRGDLFRCGTCGRWWRCVQGYANSAWGKWTPVRWYDFAVRRRIRRAETGQA